MRIAVINQDQQQREQALDPTQSFIVQAPAGSGKTELLIQRFLVLLARVSTPEEIFAITFTKKAANEMRERVIHALNQATLPQPTEAHKLLTWKLAKNVLEHDKVQKWNLLTNPNQLRIQTIDSLCAYLTRQLPLLSNFGSQPALADKPKYLYEEAVQEVLMHVEEELDWSQSIARLLLHLDNDLNKLHQLLISLLKRRDQWLPHILSDNNGDIIRAQIEHNLAQIREEYLTQLKILLPDELADELLAIADFCAGNLSETTVMPAKAGIHNFKNLDASWSLPRHVFSRGWHDKKWLFFSKMLLTSEGTWRKALRADGGFPALSSLKNPAEKTLHNEFRQRMKALLEALEPHEQFRNALADLTELPEVKIDDDQWAILLDLIYILKITTAQLRIVFQQHGKIDFIENALAALSALGNDDHPTDLALALDYKIQHLLVDEFQDTSSTQYYLLKKLTLGWSQQDGRTLFVVGDPMQSIYRFREAEVGLFIRMREKGLGNIMLTPLTLSRNFRSVQQIVDWNNQCFSRIFPKRADIATGAVPYSRSFANQEESHPDSAVEMAGFSMNIQIPPNPPFSKGGVLCPSYCHEIPPFEKGGLGGISSTSQANYIVSVIKNTKDKHPNDTIAILIRSRTHLLSLIPALKSANIAFRAVDIDPLASKQIIQDLFSLTCALLHPYDRIAWLAILRAPWCGLLLTDLLTLTNNDAKSSIWQQLSNPDILNQLSSDAQQRITRIMSVLSICVAERNRLTLRAYIENTWRMLGGPACLTSESELQDADAYFTLLEKSTENGVQLNIDDLRDKLKELFAPSSDDEKAVQIMTIHSAKGLEFDTVILPHLEKTSPNDKKSLLLWMEQPLENNNIALLLAPISAKTDEENKLYKYIARQQKIKLQHEADRLLYVAATRAKKRLNLTFLTDAESKPVKGSFLEKIWPLVSEENITQVALEEQASPQYAPRYISRLTSDWMNPIQNKFEKTLLHQSYSGFNLINNDLRFVGTAIHTILQQLGKNGLAWWKTIVNKDGYLKKILQNLSIPNENIYSSAELIETAIENTLTDQRGQWILHSHHDAQSEFPLSFLVDGQVENHIIDRTFVDEHNIRWIIDYKTSTQTKDDLQGFLRLEKEKYLPQMTKYKQAMQVLDNREIRLGLYFPFLRAWHEWE